MLPWLLLSPQLVIALLFSYWPALQSLAVATTRSNAFGTVTRFVGWDNFIQVLTDPEYLNSVGISLLFTLLVVLLSQLGGLFFAHLLFYVTSWRRTFRSLLILPFALGPVTVAVLWQFLFAPFVGMIPAAIAKFGLEWNHALNGVQGMTLLVIAASWQRVSYCGLYYLAAYFALPQSVLEASRLDCGGWRRFVSLIFPLLHPTTFFLLVVNMIYGFFDNFALVDLLTQGGPGRSTATLIYKVYLDGRVNLDLGSAAAESVLLMGLVILLVSMQFRFSDRRNR